MESPLEEIKVGEEILILEVVWEMDAAYVGSVRTLKGKETGKVYATCYKSPTDIHRGLIVVKRFIKSTPLLKALS